MKNTRPKGLREESICSGEVSNCERRNRRSGVTLLSSWRVGALCSIAERVNIFSRVHPLRVLQCKAWAVYSGRKSPCRTPCLASFLTGRNAKLESKISAWRLKAQTRPQSDSGTRTVRWSCEIPGNPVRIICNISTSLRAANAATTTAQTAPTFMIASVQPAKVGHRDSPSEPSSGIGTVRRYPVRLSGSVKVCSIKNRAAEAAPFLASAFADYRI